jgi:ABC-type glycerol-3-phosphate transport system substrate-binding protein
MKKILTASVLVLCAAMVFAGANTQRGGSNASGKVVVKLGLWPADGMDAEISMHEGFVKQYRQQYPNIDLQPVYYRYQVDTFVPMAQAGTTPTIFQTWFTEPQKLINGGFVKDISSELRTLGWDSKMNESVKQLLSKDGKIYGVPRDAYALGLMLNVDLFRQAGLVDSNGLPLYPKTWDELSQTAVTIKQKTGSAGLCLLAKDNGGGWHFVQIAWGFGANFEVQKDGKWVGQLNTPEVVAAMQWVRDLKWKYDVLTAEPTNENWDTGFRAIGTGDAAMYIAAQDAVNQPTKVNGLPLGDLALVPVPAGPKAQYSLMGGTPYMFAASATSEQVIASLRYVEIMGNAPVVNDVTLAGLRSGAESRKQDGIPIIDTFPAWTDPAYLKAQQDVTKQYQNVDPRLYADYYAAVTKPSNLRSEEPVQTQDLYSELTKVLQAVLTDQNANIQSLLDTAQRNFQRLLDADVNS